MGKKIICITICIQHRCIHVSICCHVDKATASMACAHPVAVGTWKSSSSCDWLGSHVLHSMLSSCDWLSRLYAPFLGAYGISSCFISSKNRLHYLCARVISVSRRFLSFLFQNKSSKHLIRSLKNHEKHLYISTYYGKKIIIEIYWKTRDPKYLDHNKTSLVASIE